MIQKKKRRKFRNAIGQNGWFNRLYFSKRGFVNREFGEIGILEEQIYCFRYESYFESEESGEMVKFKNTFTRWLVTTRQ